MNRPIVERERVTDKVLHQNPILNRVLQNRGVLSPEDIEYSLSKLLPFDTMKGIGKSSEIITEAILSDSRIMILGDFDCDGATSTTIMVEGLQALGARNVEFMVPHRMKHGYGLSPAVVAEFSSYRPDLLITVDNGIAAFDGIRAVRESIPGCRILVTDHHLPSKDGIPDADCIVDPCQDDCHFPSANIAGCGVAFYVIMAARAHMEKTGAFTKLGRDKPLLSPLLDVLALGTVADVVALDNNNRNIVQSGLRMINSGMVRPGLRAILELKGKSVGKIVSSDFGFAAGPCLNAAGRLEDMLKGIKCLLEKDEKVARSMAEELVQLNELRKSVENDMREEAEAEISKSESSFGFVCYRPDWHEGVVGIVASRIKDFTNRPAICMTNTEAATEVQEKIDSAKSMGALDTDLTELYEELGNKPIKGSARSVEGIHLKHTIDKIAKSHPYIFLGYGGHSMAAGLSIWKKYLTEFTRLFDEYIEREMTEEILSGKVYVDVANLPAQFINLEMAQLFKDITPWGQKFEEPEFSGVFQVVEKRVLKGRHLKLGVMKDGKVLNAIAFNVVQDGHDPFGDMVEMVYKISINEFRGSVSVQLMVSHLQNLQQQECAA